MTYCSPTRTSLKVVMDCDSYSLTRCVSLGSLLSYFFRKGQVLPTDRGRGVFQPSLDRSIDLLSKGNWVHMFPEGYVNLSRKAHLRRFKWGIGRMLMEASVKPSSRPIVIPMWITGESDSYLTLGNCTDTTLAPHRSRRYDARAKKLPTMATSTRSEGDNNIW